jgi:uncharacterized LabA/DUF88 family protein
MNDKKTISIRKCLYVDLSNLYGGICEILKPGEYIDFASILELIDDAFEGIDEIKVYGAYMGYEESANKKSKLFVKSQNEFFNSAKIVANYFGEGRISRNRQEKGVDMKLGVDIVNDAHLNRFDDYILFSEDADFDYPIKVIKEMGKNFHYCSFATRYSNALAFQAWRKVLFDYNSYYVKNRGKSRVPKKLVIKEIAEQVKIVKVS